MAWLGPGGSWCSCRASTYFGKERGEGGYEWRAGSCVQSLFNSKFYPISKSLVVIELCIVKYVSVVTYRIPISSLVVCSHKRKHTNKVARCQGRIPSNIHLTWAYRCDALSRYLRSQRKRKINRAICVDSTYVRWRISRDVIGPKLDCSLSIDQ